MPRSRRLQLRKAVLVGATGGLRAISGLGLLRDIGVALFYKFTPMRGLSTPGWAEDRICQHIRPSNKPMVGRADNAYGDSLIVKISLETGLNDLKAFQRKAQNPRVPIARHLRIGQFKCEGDKLIGFWWHPERYHDVLALTVGLIDRLTVGAGAFNSRDDPLCPFKIHALQYQSKVPLPLDPRGGRANLICTSSPSVHV